jgi:hypothetical protein
VRDYPLRIRTRCANFNNNTHAIEDYLGLIAKWEDRARQRGANLINFKPRTIADR